MQFVLNFQLVVSWLDQRLTFKNLKHFPVYSNFLSNQEQEKIWFPGKNFTDTLYSIVN